jgi:sulfite reductase (ferredoxin)
LAADLGFFGKVARKGQTPYPAYGFVVGVVLGNGRARLAEPAGEVSARDLPAFVADFLRHYLEGQPRFADFADYLEKEGKQFIHTWCVQHREIPEFAADQDFYYDWTANEVFSLAGRGIAECSAGLFDLIDLDLKRLKDLSVELPALRNGRRAEVLYQMALSAARMLLITRAIEPRSDAEVFSQYRHHFIEAGLVGAKYLPLVEAAEKKDLAGIEARADEVLSLAQTMEALYGKMDNSLRFPGERPRPAIKAPIEGTAEVSSVALEDLRGVGCPTNFLKTKLTLGRLSSGERLKVLLDDGAPIQSVPLSVAEEGHKIIEQVKEGKHWSVLLEKK